MIQARLIASLGLLCGMAVPTVALALDADAAQALSKKEGCPKCHSIDKKKEAKSFTEIAKGFAGKADAEKKILEHMVSGERVKMADGTEEDHKIIKTKDVAEQKNLIAWILSLK